MFLKPNLKPFLFDELRRWEWRSWSKFWLWTIWFLFIV